MTHKIKVHYSLPWRRGHHYYESVLKCGAKQVLDDQFRGEDETINPLEIGFLFHGFMELYFEHKEGFDCDSVDIEGPHKEQNRLEAGRLATWFMHKRAPNVFGSVKGVEKVLPEEALQGEAWASTPMGLKSTEFFGVPYTAILDLVTKMTKHDVARFYHEYHVELPGPGYYATDHKTESRDGFTDRLLASRQFTGQHALWNLCNPKTPLQGVLVNVIVKTKEPWDRVLFIPPPDDVAIEGLLYGLARAKRFLATEPAWINDRACFDWNRACTHFLEGRCDRGPQTEVRLNKQLSKLVAAKNLEVF